ncbi:carbohydrate ABC transporter permease [Ruegeria hyattellae]|uniref:carbohydrate ABC transporter permease n=1 Tax=Ruegeria hyattellae TaxID=3233337 RepID=UPI00355B2BFC
MADTSTMRTIGTLITARRGQDKLHWSDVFTYIYLVFGVLLMFGPVIWLVMSSFKTPAGLVEFPPTFLPLGQIEVEVEGYDEPLLLFDVAMEDGTTKQMAQVRRIGIVSQMVDPGNPDEKFKVPIDQRTKVREFRLAVENYVDPLERFNFVRFLQNSVIVTVVATLVTLLINSMAAYGLSIYEFRGRNAIMLFVIGTLMIPITVILVPVYLVVTQLGMINSLWAVILPGAATPTGVFLLRQYMLTIPKDLIEAARMDNASEWAIYSKVVLPLAMPAIAVLAIFSIMWRWNEFLWPLIVLNRSEVYTLQVGLNAFQGELDVQWHYILAMTVVTLIPVVVVFAFLQKFITTGIASSGMK